MTAWPDIPTGCTRISGLLATIGDKWSVPIAMTLRNGPLRFNALKKSGHGISQQMLARTLKSLERDGMVRRTVHATVPPQVEYALTSLGHSLCEQAHEIGEWAQAHIDEIESHRGRYDQVTKPPSAV